MLAYVCLCAHSETLEASCSVLCLVGGSCSLVLQLVGVPSTRRTVDQAYIVVFMHVTVPTSKNYIITVLTNLLNPIHPIV